MAEIVSYKGRNITIGTCDNLYYTSYEKYITALNSGFLNGLRGNGTPMDYINEKNGFRFRFPFPDEDKLKFGEIIEPFNRGIPVTVLAELLNTSKKGEHKNVQIDIVQQEPIRDSDGQIRLLPVFRDHDTGKTFSISKEEHIRRVIFELVRNNILNERDALKKSFYRAIAIRILKGYGLNVLKEYKTVVRNANKNSLTRKRKKNLNNRI